MLQEGKDVEAFINTAIEARMRSRRLRPNASYFAFTATAKAKTLELFGTPLPPDDEGKIGRRPFHVYTMKQAIEEKFFLNVLHYYTPISSYYRLIKTIEANPLFDSKRARAKLRRYVESHDTAIRNKAEIMVDHFLDAVLPLGEMKGEERAMVVTGAIERAVQYFHAVRSYLGERRSPYPPIVAFSGEHDFGDGTVSEPSPNGFPSSEITSRIQEDPYRFLSCADKFQTGYDEPLLQAMYVDKALGGIQAVQTLSRLNRAAPGKKRVFIVDFQDNAAAVEAAFADYYKTTLLSEATYVNKLHDLRDSLDQLQVYTWKQVEAFVALFLGNSDREALQPILNECRKIYSEQLNEDDQVAFKSKAKVFVRSYDFLATILTHDNPEWEKLSIFLTLLVRALPAPEEDDLTKGMLILIDMDTYRIEKQELQRAPARSRFHPGSCACFSRRLRCGTRTRTTFRHCHQLQRAIRHQLQRRRSHPSPDPRRDRSPGGPGSALPQCQSQHAGHRRDRTRRRAESSRGSPVSGSDGILQAA